MGLYYDEIFCSPDMEQDVNELVNTPRGFDTVGLNENQAARERTGLKRVIVLPHLSSTSLVVLSNSKLRKQLVYWYESEAPDYGTMTEFNTRQIKTSGYMRYGAQVRGYRWCYVLGV